MQIHISRNGQSFGPYTLEEVNAYLTSGHLNVNDMAWFEGCADWMPLSHIAGVQVPASAVAPPTPPASPVVAPQAMVSAPQHSSPHSAGPQEERTIFEITPTPDVVLTVLTCGLWLLVLVPKALTNRGCKYKLTTQRLILTTGLASRRVEEVELYRVKDVTASQGVLGRMLGFGTVLVHGNDASTPRLTMHPINSPMRVKEQIRDGSRATRRTEGVRAVEYGAAG